MPDYRLYRLDPFTGHFIGVEELHAADDVSAIHMIQQRAYGSSVELWQGGRKVTRLDAPLEGAAQATAAPRKPLR